MINDLLDLTELEDHFMRIRIEKSDLTEARLLMVAGRIEQGTFRFFRDEELRQMLEDAGLEDIKIHSCFGDPP